MKPPAFLSNLYADLRDRRLVPLIVVLVIAIPAVPLLLGNGSVAPPVSSETAGAALADQEIPTLPAVLAADPGLRDYHERLDALRSKNPFAEHFEAPDNSESAVGLSVGGSGGASGVSTAGESSVAGGALSGAGTSTSTAQTAGSASSTTTGSSTTSTPSSGSTSSGSTSSGSSSSGSGQGSPPASGQWFTYRIDVVTGLAGDAKPRKDVKRGTVLPSQSNPVALFLGASEGGKRATFLVSTDVVRTHGDGNCVPSPSDCQILDLEPGQERKFTYAPPGDAPDTYLVKLKDIHLVEIDDPERSGKSSAGRQTKSAHGGLKSFLGL
jgi:hypothetical protein